MQRFPYITDYVNEVFGDERESFDFRFIRPALLVAYFFIRTIAFPIKFTLHRIQFGFEPYLIDATMAWGMKYFAKHSAAELFVRHVQIEPILYRHLLSLPDKELSEIKMNDAEESQRQKLNGIDGDFNVESLRTVVKHNMTFGHDQLSYEIVDRFDKKSFLENLDYIRSIRPEDHEQLSKAALEENQRCSFQILGPTNIVMLIVITITIFGDFHTTIKALNSFGSDSILLWCMRHLYANDPDVLIDLDFFMQEVSNRGHYNSSAFFSNPSQYLYYHVVFDEVVYDLLTHHPPTPRENHPHAA